LPNENSIFHELLSKHLEDIIFDTVFEHPQKWAGPVREKAPEFIPLLLNERNEIVSFAHCINNSIVLVFPDILNKTRFISDLFKTCLPEIVPELFPFHGEFKWLESGDYPLPGEGELIEKRAEIEEKFNRDIKEYDEKMAAIKLKYKFLSDLIVETGKPLVSAVESYLKWLGFDSVINLDDTSPEVLEEDIQVDYIDRFLVVEIKGIGGTSTDKDCSQISKIKYRRAEQRGKFDVYGLYIVNHQRYMPPKSRAEPPFSENQIKDAVHDKRGLVTTYELYKSYFLIKEGILEKQLVRESLFNTGLIKLEPDNILSIGIPNELFMSGHVAILYLEDTSITVGDILLVKRQGEYSKAKIESLKVDDAPVDCCSSGEVGIKLDRKIKRNSELFVIRP
jgi:hypothetical protein